MNHILTNSQQSKNVLDLVLTMTMTCLLGCIWIIFLAEIVVRLREIGY